MAAVEGVEVISEVKRAAYRRQLHRLVRPLSVQGIVRFALSNNLRLALADRGIL